MSGFQALTVEGNGLLRVISSPIDVCTPIMDRDKGPDKKTSVMGIWDTGASGSVITQSVVDALRIQPISMAQVNTASGQSLSPVYLVDFILSNGVVLQGARVTLGKLPSADVLIGMDIINVGDFVITNYQGKTKMSFRTPSQAEVDYVKEANSTQTTIDGHPLTRQQRKQLEREEFKKWKQNQSNS